PIVLVLQFISVVYLAFNLLPTWLQNIASIFPLKWIAQGMRSVFLPDNFEAIEPSGSWQHEATAIVLLIWLVAGIIACRVTFRWIRKDT
ncbi:MAG TPA: ABC transporter permease, partial [Diaminobutyricibacter sp.]